MKLELTQEMIKAFKNKEIDFKKTYENEFEYEFKELEYLVKNDLELFKKKTGILFPFVYKKFGGDVTITADDVENAKMLGFNPGDLDYITNFAIACIIEDRKLKLGNDINITEMLQPENILIEKEKDA
jgi:hypothetical protein